MTQVLYASLAGSATTSDLYTVDPATGVMTSIGPMGDAMSGLAVDPTDGTLYGCSGFHSAANQESLFTIDTGTGVATLIANFVNVHEIAFDATGQLWGVFTDGSLTQIDKTTGITTPVGSASSHYSGGFDIDSGGVFQRVGCQSDGSDGGTFNVPQTATIDSSTGDYTHVADTSDGNFLHSGKYDALGTFWGSSPGESGSGATDLVTVDPATGTVTPQATFSVPGVGGLVWAAPATPVLRARFTATPLAGFPPLSVTFTDQSTPGPSGPITGWNWDFGDSSGSTSQNPSHTYTSPGSYTVTLTVTGTTPDGTATLIKSNYILVFGPQSLYAALAGPSSTSDLYTVDPVTAVMTVVGPIGFAVTGMAMDPTTGIVYGATSSHSASHPHSLITIDTNTGAGTLVGALSISRAAHDIAFDATGQLWGWDSTGGALWQIDKTNGSVTVVGSAVSTFSGGLDFDSGGTLWKVGYTGGKIGTVDTSTGAVTFVINTSDGNEEHSGKFDQSGLFWASDGGESGAAGTNLVTVDIGTGTVTVIAAFSVPKVGAVAWISPPPTTPDFLVSLVPNSINVSDGISTLVHLNTTALHGDTETITLSTTPPSGFTVTFPDNPITAGDTGVPIDIAVGSPSVGTYSIVIHCVGTDNSHDVTLTVHVLTIVPGFHISE